MTSGFTSAGFVVLGIAGLILAANDKTGPALLFVLVLMILLVLLSHYKEAEQVLFK